MSGATLLEGVTVIEAGSLLPVPAAAARLQRLGARVLKLSPPGGDPARVLYGGWLHELYGHGKEERTVDLFSPEGRSSVGELLDAADAILVGYRPEAALRLGLDAATVLEGRSRLVHCSVVGFPGDGPLAAAPAHDLVFLARSGALLEPAGPSAEGAAPRRPAVPVADLAGAAAAVEGVLAALLARARTGSGAALEIALDTVALAWMAPRLGGAVDERFGPALDPANDVYECADGRWLATAAIEGQFWAGLLGALDAVGELPDGAATWSSHERIEQRTVLGARIAAIVALRDSAHWLEALAAADVPAALVFDGREAAARVGSDLDDWRAAATPLPFVPDRR